MCLAIGVPVWQALCSALVPGKELKGIVLKSFASAFYVMNQNFQDVKYFSLHEAFHVSLNYW
jgi:hypothetical protein